MEHANGAMLAPAWSFEHTVEAAVGKDLAWRFWTNVSNWAFDTSLEWVRLEPGFVAGAKGVTKQRGADPVEWSIREVEDGHATIEMTFPGALVSFRWTFEAMGPGRTRMTQVVALSGPKAEGFSEMAEGHLAKGIPEGMRKLVEEVERTARLALQP
jgi:hypothetical protein